MLLLSDEDPGNPDVFGYTKKPYVVAQGEMCFAPNVTTRTCSIKN